MKEKLSHMKVNFVLPSVVLCQALCLQTNNSRTVKLSLGETKLRKLCDEVAFVWSKITQAVMISMEEF